MIQTLLLACLFSPAAVQLDGGDTLVADLVPGAAGSSPAFQAAAGERLLLTHTTPVGTVLWSSDGTSAGTVDLAVFAGPGVSPPSDFAEVGGRVLFSTDEALWTSDGTPAGTTPFLNYQASLGIGVQFPSWSASLGDRAVVCVRGLGPGSSESESHLVVTDGTAGGTVWIGTLLGSLNGRTAGERIYFLGNDGGGAGYELWTTDGSAPGTAQVLDANPGGNAALGASAELGGDLVGAFEDAFGDRELWRSDGSAAGTVRLADIQPGPLGSTPGSFAPVGVDAPGVLVFSATGPEGLEPWRTDGTSAGTFLLADLRPGPDGGLVGGPVGAGPWAYFFARPVPGGASELWRTDGSVAGTALVASFVGSATTFEMSGLPDGRVVFGANGGSAGDELWVSDGTAAGTELLADIDPAGSSEPGFPRRVGANVFFRADDGSLGSELHAVTVAEAGGWVVERYGAGCSAAPAAPRATWSGAPSLGDTFSVGVEGAAPLAAVVHVFGTGFAELPLGAACVLWVDAPGILGGYTADAAGAGTLPPTPLPDEPALAGLLLTFQAAASEPGGPYLGFALSDGLEVVVGP
ncbi:MAG: hypothetical protein AAF682_23145 [Planctomycetota bacterium]